MASRLPWPTGKIQACGEKMPAPAQPDDRLCGQNRHPGRRINRSICRPPELAGMGPIRRNSRRSNRREVASGLFRKMCIRRTTDTRLLASFQALNVYIPGR